MFSVSVPDALWSTIAPMLPPHKASPKGGRPPKDDRQCLEGIAFVLRTGCQWQNLPPSPLWPSGSTCYRRFAEWTKAGVWPRVHRALLDVLGKSGLIDPSTVIADSASTRAEKGGRTPGRARSTGAKRAASGTCSARRPASRWRSSPRRRTSGTSSR